MAEKRVSKNKKNKKVNILRVIRSFFYVLFLVLIYFACFIKMEFNEVSFEQLVFALTNPEGANYEIVWRGAFFIIVCLCLTVFVWYLIKRMYYFLKISVTFKVSIKGKKIDKVFNFHLFKRTKAKGIVIFLIFMICSIAGSICLIDLDDYIKTQITNTLLFDEYYVEPKDVNLVFPEKKRNLIYIFVESLEASNVSVKNGGIVEKSYIPEMEKLGLENINFSNNTKLGGAIQLSNTSWTMAGLVSQTSGLPLKVPIDWNTYGGYKKSLPGAYSLGEVLQKNGYNNYFMLGSDADYGGRKSFFEQHGDYEIYDYYWAIDKGLINKDYKVWWGYEDQKLFQYAKEKLLEIAEDDEPFNFTLLTADTHFTDGYMDSSCKKPFASKYANSFYCSDAKIGEFIRWIQEQDFYENTTVVIVGDHLTMQSNFYSTNDNSLRRVYNVFMNSAVTTKNEKNRQFSHFDLYPTTLAALGVKIENERLGLGVNLFSDKKTLIEELGVEYLNSEISKKSFYYDKEILADSYYDMINNKEEL